MNEPYAVAPAASSLSGAPPLRPTVSAQTIGPNMMITPRTTKKPST